MYLYIYVKIHMYKRINIFLNNACWVVRRTCRRFFSKVGSVVILHGGPRTQLTFGNSCRTPSKTAPLPCRMYFTLLPTRCVCVCVYVRCVCVCFGMWVRHWVREGIGVQLCGCVCEWEMMMPSAMSSVRLGGCACDWERVWPFSMTSTVPPWRACVCSVVCVWESDCERVYPFRTPSTVSPWLCRTCCTLHVYVGEAVQHSFTLQSLPSQTAQNSFTNSYM